MIVLYDFQEDFKNVKPGEFKKSEIISVRSDPSSTSTVEEVEDVKTIFLTDRAARESGIYIHLNKIKELIAGDRITITGRIGSEAPRGPVWSIALLSDGRKDGHLTQHISPGPGSVFALSHILDHSEVDNHFAVHTIGWGGVLQPLMDFYIDGILITRKSDEGETELDSRTVIYAMETDEMIEHIASEEIDSFGEKIIVARSGLPIINIFPCADQKALHVGTRVNDWDGIDIMLSHLRLRPGNQYKITVKGRIDGDAPDGSVLMLQGIPSYAWRSNIAIIKDMEFTLEHTLTISELEKWTTVRITTNGFGAAVSFYIYDINIVKV
jgi:hypothetical protein